MVKNRPHAVFFQGHPALRQRGRRAGSQTLGACVAHVKAARRLTITCGLFCLAAPAAAMASVDVPPAATSFAYSASHPAKPLPDDVLERIAESDPEGFILAGFGAVSDDDARTVEISPEARAVMSRQLSRSGLCSAVASVARANDLPIPFFANLIWQESSFNTKTISRAGAQGIAQFMPKTAVQFGLINPFDPIHALNVAGKFVRDLYGQFGNLGLAAAAYNAGPRRVADWIAKRGALPSETRNYVVRITGRPADQWISSQIKNDPEAALMPAQAPCAEVAEAVRAQTKTVHLAKLMKELTAAATQARESSVEAAKDPVDLALVAAAEADPRWSRRALRMVNDVVKRLTAKVGRKTLERMAAKSAMQPRIKLAMLELGASNRLPPERDNGVFDERRLADSKGSAAGGGAGVKVRLRADTRETPQKGPKSVAEADGPKAGDRRKGVGATTGSAKTDDAPPAKGKAREDQVARFKSRDGAGSETKSSARLEAGKTEARHRRRAPRRSRMVSSIHDRIF